MGDMQHEERIPQNSSSPKSSSFNADEPPMVFQCSQCNVIVGDSTAWVCVDDISRTITLKSMYIPTDHGLVMCVIIRSNILIRLLMHLFGLPQQELCQLYHPNITPPPSNTKNSGLFKLPSTLPITGQEQTPKWDKITRFG